MRTFSGSGFLPGTELSPYVRRLGSLRRLNKLGAYFTAEKQDALFRGDTSNAVVNRYFVYGSQAIGTHLCGALDESPTMARLLAVHGQKAWETLIEIQKLNDRRLFAQGLLFFVYSLIIMGWPLNSQFYLLKVCEFIDKGNLRFLPAYGRSPELSEQVREDAAVLSQTIYLENYFYLALGGLAPTKTTKIEREFRRDFQVRTICCMGRSELSDVAQQAYPHLFDLCPLTMRTQCILLTRDATLVLDSHSTNRTVNLNVSLRVPTDSHYL